jgi:histidinol-phosphate/aromatic aminotransferase/cobyric acid decarboxylase-like protein
MAPWTFTDSAFATFNLREFERLRCSERVLADPSGWTDTFTVAAALVPEVVTPSREDLGRYYLDEGQALGARKESIVNLVRAWEDRNVSPDEVTLAHSVSEASFLLLICLRALGVRTIVFETPCYAVTINQAQHLSFRTIGIPTYCDDSFALRFSREHDAPREPIALWLTQPRMSLGFNQSAEAVTALFDQLGGDDFLVIDEATERRFPSVLRNLPQDPRLVRIRGFVKGLGLNGVRLSFLLHNAELRESLELAHEVSGGSVDIFSLAFVATLGKDPETFRALCNAVDAQIVDLRAAAAAATRGTNITTSDLVNGYIGSAFVTLGGPYEESRNALLTFCHERGVPILCGAAMHFATDHGHEPVRLNYFNRPQHILDGLSALISFANGGVEP